MRRRLPNRREHEVVDLEHGGIRYTVGIGRAVDGSLAEVFIDSGKAGSTIDAYARDGAILVSLLLQYGITISAIRHSITRLPKGGAAGPLGAVLDRLSQMEV